MRFKQLVDKYASKLVYKYSNLFDSILFILLIFSIPGIYFFTKFGGIFFKRSRELLKKSRVYLIPDHYYYPLFKDSRLKKSLRYPRFLPGVDFEKKNSYYF